MPNFALYRYDNSNGTQKDWAIEMNPKSQTECITRFGSSDNRSSNPHYLRNFRVVSTFNGNSVSNRETKKKAKGYYFVTNIDLDDDGMLIDSDEGRLSVAKPKDPSLFYWDYSPITSIPVGKKDEMYTAFHKACENIAMKASFIEKTTQGSSQNIYICIRKGVEEGFMRFDSSHNGFDLETDRGSGVINITEPFGFLWLIFIMALKLELKDAFFQLQGAITIVNDDADTLLNNSDIEEIAKTFNIDLEPYKEDLYNLEILLRPFKLLNNEKDEISVGIPHF